MNVSIVRCGLGIRCGKLAIGEEAVAALRDEMKLQMASIAETVSANVTLPKCQRRILPGIWKPARHAGLVSVLGTETITDCGQRLHPCKKLSCLERCVPSVGDLYN